MSMDLLIGIKYKHLICYLGTGPNISIFSLLVTLIDDFYVTA